MTQKNLWGLLFLVMAVITSCTQDDSIIAESNNPNQPSQSGIISIEDAQIELEKLLCDIHQSQLSRSPEASTNKKVIANAFTIKDAALPTRAPDDVSPVIHVFNFENEEGFALMAGNEGIPSLLALADSGEIIESDYIDNPGFALFLENMETKYMENLSEASYSKSASAKNYKVYGEWENIVYNQNGLCRVKWNQRNPYNKYCPKKDGKQTVTGCVATAVAQLMSIYQYPTSYKNYSFNWNAMTKSSYAWSCTSDAQDQIARLMAELGTKSNLDMSYNLAEKGGSAAKANNIPRTLKNFGYSNGGNLKDYNTSTVVSELKNGHAVLAGGFSHKTINKFLGIKVKTKYSGGHRWLCHGLLERRRTVKTYNSNGVLQKTTTESEWYPLCNWGWGGYQDGYYLSSAFNSNDGPAYSSETRNSDVENDSEDGNFQYKITAVTGIRK